MHGVMRYTKGAPRFLNPERPRGGILHKASCDADYCNLLLQIEGIALQGSFLLPYVFAVCMDHARISKGVSRPLPGFGTFFFSAKRKYRKEKPLGISPDLLN